MTGNNIDTMIQEAVSSVSLTDSQKSQILHALEEKPVLHFRSRPAFLLVSAAVLLLVLFIYVPRHEESAAIVQEAARNAEIFWNPLSDSIDTDSGSVLDMMPAEDEIYNASAELPVSIASWELPDTAEIITGCTITGRCHVICTEDERKAEIELSAVQPSSEDFSDRPSVINGRQVFLYRGEGDVSQAVFSSENYHYILHTYHYSEKELLNLIDSITD